MIFGHRIEPFPVDLLGLRQAVGQLFHKVLGFGGVVGEVGQLNAGDPVAPGHLGVVGGKAQFPISVAEGAGYRNLLMVDANHCGQDFRYTVNGACHRITEADPLGTESRARAGKIR